MSSDPLNRISQTQKERLFYIDFLALFAGRVRRGDLMNRFGIAEAAATRDLSLYKSLVPEALIYDAGRKVYLATPAYKPLFDHEPERSLEALSQGIGDDSVNAPPPHLPAERPLRPAATSLDIVSAVSRAIVSKQALSIHYVSLTSGWTERRISPHAIVDNGLRWHARAFDERSGQFRDFLLNRMAATSPASSPPAEAERERDEQWMRIVHMQIVPHPHLDHAEAIAADFGMINECLHLTLRAALVGYVARVWGIDCSPDHTANPRAFPLWLQNSETLYGVESMSFAPIM